MAADRGRSHETHQPPAVRPRRVLVTGEEYRRSARQAMQGVSQYSREYGRWEFVNVPGRRPAIEIIEQFGGVADGIIAQGSFENFRALSDRLPAGVPLVTLMNRHDGSMAPVVTDDERSIAAAAFDHFRAIGLEHFAFVGQYVERTERSEAFVEHLRQQGYTCPLIAPDVKTHWPEQIAYLGRWLRDLPKPVGVLAFEGWRARNTAAACQEAGLRVPEEVAILSVGDELACEMAWPPISAIDLACQRMGYEAAAMLDQMMAGRPLQRRKLVIHPRGIIRRQSTDLLAVGNTAVSEALRFIRDHVGEAIKPEHVLAAVNVSRSYLEKAFKDAIGRTIHQEITRVRIQLTREMLTRTDLPLPDVAVRCGFSDRTRLSSIFKRETGQTPKAFRETARRGRRAG